MAEVGDFQTDQHSQETPQQASISIRRQRSGWQVVAGIAALLIIFVAVLLGRDARPPEVQPLKAERLSHLVEFRRSYRNRMLWGTYRPGFYFGMRMREPKSLLTGLMWFDPDQPEALQSIRHQAQDRDGLSKYGWERHDGESFGRQELYDGRRHISTSFTKRFCEGCRGGDWAVRCTMAALPAEEGLAVQQGDGHGSPERLRGSLIFYVADESGAGAGRQGGVSIHDEDHQDGGAVLLASGDTAPIGGWQLHAAAPTGKQLPQIRYLGLRSEHFHNLSDLVAAGIVRSSVLGAAGRRPQLHAFGSRAATSLPDEVEHDSNVALFQISGALPLSLDLVFTGSLTPAKVSRWPAMSEAYRMLTGRAGPKVIPWLPSVPPAETVRERVDALLGDQLTQLLRAAEAAFDQKFASKFCDLETAGNPKGTAEVAKAALSDMLGGMGYFYGTSAVRLDGKVVQSWPAALFTAVPSRSFFPRGFLWDEGFHQLLIRKWSPALSRDILAHWLDLLNSQGWIAREQILGEEARSRVPPEFMVQDPTAANPPTLFLPLADMARQLAAKAAISSFTEGREEADFLRAAFPRMRAWLDWFIRTQQGQLPGSWRWRGRHLQFVNDPFTGAATDLSRELNPKTLTSGLDDFPRASHPSKEERHVDLYCWMSLAAGSLATIGKALDLPQPQVEPYERLSSQLLDFQHLNELHFDAAAQQYRDWGTHTEDVRLDWRYIEVPQQWQAADSPASGMRRRLDMVRFVDSPPHLQFVPHHGYVSLFPLLMRLLPADSPQLAAQLHHLKAGGMWTPFGLRSLSRSSSLYGKRNTEHDPPYWRGPIWINLNFLVLASLKHYSQEEGPYAASALELHDSLRAGLLKLIVDEFHGSGYLWENYDAERGTGRGCRPFSGWTALVVLIAGESYF